MEHSIWFVPLVVVTALAVYQLFGPFLLCDYRIGGDQIEIVAFRFLPIDTILFSEREEIRLAKSSDFFKLPMQYISRPLSGHVYIKRSRGFPRRILITPLQPEEFVTKVRSP